MNVPTGAIVLAGGKSERMGADKALLMFHGRSLLENAVATVGAYTRQIVVVTADLTRYTVSGARVVADLFPDAGPVGGIYTGLTALRGEQSADLCPRPGHCIVVACDMPTVQPAVIDLLLSAIELAADQAVDAVIPEIGGRLEPLCAVYRHTAAPKLREFLQTGRRAAYKAIEALNTVIIREEQLRSVDPALATFTNLNAPQDLERLGMRVSS